MKKPVNLKTHFGDRFQIRKDPAFDIPGQPPEDKEWLYQLPTKMGGKDSHVFSFGFFDSPNALGFFGRSGIIRERVLKVPGTRLHVRGDGEFIIVFPLSAFEAVAEIVKPRLKRHLTPENREKRRQAMVTCHRDKNGRILSI